MTSAERDIGRADRVMRDALASQDAVKYAAAVDSLGLKPADMSLYEMGKVDSNYEKVMSNLRPTYPTSHKKQEANLFTEPVSEVSSQSVHRSSYESNKGSYIPSTVNSLKKEIRKFAKMKGVPVLEGLNEMKAKDKKRMTAEFFKLRDMKKA